MPVVLGESLSTPPDAPPRKRWTREEIAILERSGAWDDRHYELVEGDLIDKMGKKRPHYSAVAYIMALLLRVFGPGRVVPEAPIDVAPEDNPTSEPEPDIFVLHRPLKEITGDHPQPSDVALLIEVADTTLRSDLSVKAALYARAGIVEYWVVDLNGRRLIVHREPGAGVYGSVVAYAAGESVTPLAAGESFAVGELLG